MAAGTPATSTARKRVKAGVTPRPAIKRQPAAKPGFQQLLRLFLAIGPHLDDAGTHRRDRSEAELEFEVVARGFVERSLQPIGG